MMKNLIITFLKVFISFSIICQDNTVLEITELAGPRPWTSLDFKNDPRNFQFAIVTDRTGGHRPGVFMDGVNKLNLLQPQFVMSVGDLIEGYTEDLNELNHQWDEFDGFVGQLEMPFFYIPGNHDITNQVMEDLWKERLGPTYYHFKYHDVLFLCLNSEDQRRGAGRGTVSDEQLAYMKKVLKENKAVRWTLVFMHQPLWHQEKTKQWPELEKLLSNRKHTVFTGHEHRYVKTERNNGKYFVLATTGGGSNLRGPELGEFDHVVWVTMTDQGPVIANLDLNGIWDENLVTQKAKDFFTTILENPPVEIEPIFMEGNNFTEGTTTIKITNDEDSPLNVVVNDKFSWDLTCIINVPEFTVNPNSVEMVDLVVKPKNKSHDKPLGITINATYNADYLDVTIPFEWKIKPLRKIYISFTDRKIKIDGENKEWDVMVSRFKQNENEFKFDVVYDENFLYIACDVTDDKIISKGKGVPWSQDNIGIVVNAETTSKSAMSKGNHWYRDDFFIQVTPEHEGNESVISRKPPEGTQYKVRSHKTGYFGEFAIPMSYIHEKQGEKWQTVRINVMVDDNDDGEQKERLWWQPDWRLEDNIIGSGTFFRKRGS